MISPEIVEEIKFKSDIEDVISSYVVLKNAGSNLTGLCPFHNEKTPSFTVFKSSKNFYCFGCGAGGDVITFIMKAENLSYPEALEFLAKRAGITIPASISEERTGVRRERLFAMNRDAARFFHAALKENTGEAAEYVYKKRALSKAIVNRFGLGYAPNDFNALGKYLSSLGYTDEEMIAGFLCRVSQKNGRLFDMFRNRIMFPIIDTAGNIVAFGGRVLDDSLPKYLNSSDTPIFKKSRNLFALNFAKKFEETGKRLILCEGYMDVIALHSAGFENAVATLGTAITPDHARIMAKYTKNVVVSYDSDEAGQKAAAKALKLLNEVGIDGRVLKVVGAKDPDEFLRKNGEYGKEKFNLLLDNSSSRFDFRLDSILKKYDLAVPDEKLRACSEVCIMLAEIYSSVERELALSAAASKLGVSRESLKADTDRAAKRLKRDNAKNEQKTIYTKTAGFGDRINTDAIKNKTAANAEETILGLLLLFPEYITKIKSGTIKLCVDDFFTSFGKRVFTKLFELTDDTGRLEFGLLGESFNPDEMGRITSLRLRRERLSTNTEDILLESINKLKLECGGDELSDIEKILEGKRSKDLADK